MVMVAKKNPKIFISYARSDEKFAIKLAKSLKESGVNIWIDQIDIPKGALWDHSVEAAMSSSECYLIILSPVSIESKNVIDEISYAQDENKIIIPLLYRNCKTPYRLRRYNYIDFTGDFESSLNVLISSLRVGEYLVEPTENINHTAFKDLIIYVSHPYKHKKIADIFRETIRIWSNDNINKILQTSEVYSPTNLQPLQISKENTELFMKSVLFFLIYENAESDSHTLFELGTRMNNKSIPAPRLIVIQCGAEAPSSVISMDLLIRLTTDDIKKFTSDFHLDERFFPGIGQAFAPLTPNSVINEKSKELYHKLKLALPRRNQEQPTTSPHWINFLVSLDMAYAHEIEQIANSLDDEGHTLEKLISIGMRIIEERCNIEDYSENMPRHFDISELWKGRDKFIKLYERWKNYMIREQKEEYLSLDWWREICCQIVRSISRYRSIEIQVPIKSVADQDTWFLPVVTEKRIRPEEEKMKFLIWLIRIPQKGPFLNIDTGK
jgi:hypothetical protein